MRYFFEVFNISSIYIIVINVSIISIVIFN